MIGSTPSPPATVPGPCLGHLSPITRSHSDSLGESGGLNSMTRPLSSRRLRSPMSANLRLTWKKMQCIITKAPSTHLLTLALRPPHRINKMGSGTITVVLNPLPVLGLLASLFLSCRSQFKHSLHPSTSLNLSSFLPTFSIAHRNRRTARRPIQRVLVIESRPGFKR
jgi:hypothetical protein